MIVTVSGLVGIGKPESSLVHRRSLVLCYFLSNGITFEISFENNLRRHSISNINSDDSLPQIFRGASKICGRGN